MSGFVYVESFVVVGTDDPAIARQALRKGLEIGFASGDRLRLDINGVRVRLYDRHHFEFAGLHRLGDGGGV